jgi:trans-aconitate methyltransferase
MLLTDAVNLIANGVAKRPSIWADLGCGNGLFTQALAKMLPAHSTIHAVDVNKTALNKIPDQYNGVKVMKEHCDFINDPLTVPPLDGILMANALHFVKEKKSFIKKIEGLMHSGSQVIIVEYDMTTCNQWVPYPIPFHELKELFSTVGFDKINQLGSRPSIYHQSLIYAALLKRA